MSRVGAMEALRESKPLIGFGAIVAAAGALAASAERADAFSADGINPEIAKVDFDGNGTYDSISYKIKLVGLDPDGNSRPVKLDGAIYTLSASDGSVGQSGNIADLFYSGRPPEWALFPSPQTRRPDGLYDGELTRMAFVANPESGTEITATQTIVGNGINLPAELRFVPNPNAVQPPSPTPAPIPTPGTGGGTQLLQPEACLRPDLKLTLKQKGGQNSKQWLAQIALSMKGKMAIEADGNFADKDLKKAKLAAGFTLKSTAPIKTIDTKFMRTRGTARVVDLKNDAKSGSITRINVPFTLNKGTPKISVGFRAPKSTVSGCGPILASGVSVAKSATSSR